MSYTQGPWTLNQTEQGHEVIAEPDGVIADVYRTTNARLIAAAPDLLEAAREALDAMTGEQPFDQRRAVHALRAAIAEAEGD